MAWTKLPRTVGNIMLQYCLINCQWQSKENKNKHSCKQHILKKKVNQPQQVQTSVCLRTAQLRHYCVNQLTPTVRFQQSTHLCIFLPPWLKLPHLSNRCRQDTEVWQDELQHSLTQLTCHLSVSPTPSNHHGDLDFKTTGLPLISASNPIKSPWGPRFRKTTDLPLISASNPIKSPWGPRFHKR